MTASVLAAPVVGTAGWSLASRYSADFPREGTHLARYAAVFGGVEINSSFYRRHRPETYRRWAASTPEAFRFAVKLPKAITHERRLVDASDLLDTFLDEVGGLGPKLGPVLMQLPPSLAFDGSVAPTFMAHLRRRYPGQAACEPRHASWFRAEVSKLLLEHRIARVAADPPRVPAAAQPGGWDGLAYFRLHGSPRMYWSDYEPERLAAVADMVAAHGARGASVWCIFDNTASAAATGNALTVAQALGLPTRR